MMIAMFVVDDEDMEREGIRTLCDWEQHGIAVVGEAWNGHSALEALADVEPDLVISDVRMPGMNGLEFASRLKRRYPHVKFIFISGYEDFEAARNAVDVNAFAYLMKPIRADTLLKTIAEASGQIREERHKAEEGVRLQKQVEASLPALQEQFLRDRLLGFERIDGARTIQQAKRYGMTLPVRLAAVMVVRTDTPAEPDTGEDETHSAAIRMYRELSALIREETALPAVMTREGECAVLVPCSDALAPEETEEHLERMAERWARHLRLTTGQPCTIGIALAGDGVLSLHRHYRQALAAVSRKFYLPARSVIWHEDDEEPPEQYPVVSHRTRDELREALLVGDTEKIERLVVGSLRAGVLKREQAWFVAADLLNTALHVLAEKKELMRLALEREGAPWANLMRMETIEALTTLVAGYIQRVAEWIKSGRGTRNEHVVRTIKLLVQTEYGSDLSIEAIAARVFHAPGYVRKIFKNETGITLKEYIVQTRMTKACELLRQPERKVNEVAAAVGYDNVSYFCAVFKNFYGTSPGEFKDAYQTLV